MPKILVAQHIACETLGTIADALVGAGMEYQYLRPFAGEPVPKQIGDASGLIIMGGPMGVYERDSYPFLAAEMRLIENALAEQKPILGVCLGSQLLAATLGVAVTKGEKKEIGWHPVRLKDASPSDPLWAGVESAFTALHWHGDIFALPRGAVSLACSALTEHQAFRYGENAYGFLFHMEATPTIIEEMVKNFAGELGEAAVDGGEILTRRADHLPRLHAIGDIVFHRWASLVIAAGHG
jgi:GMP synthase (glutamine-hydrolysing)